MADPSIPFVNVAANNTFQLWVNITNNLVNDMQSFVITANTTGGLTTGNAYVNGAFSALELLTPSLSGGNLSASANLSVISNVSIGNTTANVWLGYGQINVGTWGVNGSASFIGNSTVNSVINSSSIVTGLASLSSRVNVGSNVTLGLSGLTVGNTTANLAANSILVVLANSTASANYGPGGPVVGTSVVNSSGHFANAAGVLSVGNTTVNALVNSTAFLLNGNPIGNLFVSVSGTPVGNAPNINFIPAGSVSITGSMNSGTVNVIISATSGGGGGTPGGSNTYLQFNDSGSFNGTSGFVFNKATNVAQVSNALAVGSNVTLNTSALFVGNTTANLGANSILVSLTNSTSGTNVSPGGLVAGVVVINTSALAVGANVSANTTSLFVGNTTVSAFTNSILHQLSTATTSANLSASGLSVGLSLVNALGVFVGANVSQNASTLWIGNSTVNALVNSSSVLLGNTVTLGLSGLTFGNSTTNTSIGPSDGFFGNATVNALVGVSGGVPILALANSTVSVNVGLGGFLAGANVSANTTVIFVGNTTVNTSINSSSVFTTNVFSAGANVSLNTSVLFLGNTTINTFVNSSSVTIDGSVVVNNNGLTVNSVPLPIYALVNELYGGL